MTNSYLKYKEYYKQWRLKNKERISDYHKQYILKYKTRISDNNHRHYIKNKQHLLELQRIRRKRSPRSLNSHKNNLKDKYGITLELYNIFFNKQIGRCAICGIHQSQLKYRLHVDHDHRRSTLRGLLCRQCNIGLANFKDNPELFNRARVYLLETLSSTIPCKTI